jgi:hypothetical protein
MKAAGTSALLLALTATTAAAATTLAVQDDVPAPGTVAYAGYGSLLEQRAWDGSRWHSGEGDYLTPRRGLFFKASCAKRF